MDGCGAVDFCFLVLTLPSRENAGRRENLNDSQQMVDKLWAITDVRSFTKNISAHTIKQRDKRIIKSVD